jgi:hypothetical protein
MEVWLDGERLEVIELRRCEACGALTTQADHMFHWESAHESGV